MNSQLILIPTFLGINPALFKFRVATSELTCLTDCFISTCCIISLLV